MFLTVLIFIAFCFTKTIDADQQLNLTRGSLLLYLDQIQHEEGYDILSQVCNERKYAYSVYYRMLYFRFCSDNSSDEQFENFCDDIDQYYNSSYSTDVLNSIKTTADDQDLFGPGIESDHLWEAKMTCQSVRIYFQDKYALTNGSNGTENSQQPKYTEWIIHIVPFCLPVTCGFTERVYYNQTPHPSLKDCLPSSYRAALFIVYCIDSLIIAGTLLANLLILIVTPKTKIAATPHGRFRISLAVADMLTALVVSGAIHTTYTLYNSSHAFTEEGDQITALHYHDETYINTFGVFGITSLSASIFMLVVISMDRFAAIYRPLVYATHIRKMESYASLTILFVWVLSFIIAIVPVFIPYIPYTLTSGGLIIAVRFYIVYIVFLGLSLLSVWALNVALYISVKRRPKFVATQPTISATLTHSPDISLHQRLKKARTSWVSMTALISKRFSTVSIAETSSIHQEIDKQACSRKKLEVSLATTVRYIVIAFSLTILPPIIAMGIGIISSMNPNSSNFNPLAKATWNAFAYLSSRILFANSFINCIIYSYRSSNFRSVLKKLLFFRHTGPAPTCVSKIISK